jgi:hypothetical protein
MAQLDVEPKKNNDWWKWVLGILAAIIVIWVIIEAMDDDVDDDVIEDEPVAVVETYKPLSTPVLKA